MGRDRGKNKLTIPSICNANFEIAFMFFSVKPTMWYCMDLNYDFWLCFQKATHTYFMSDIISLKLNIAGAI